jgi:hypothetical protein
LLASPFFLEQLQPLRAFNTVRLPVTRSDGSVELLGEGYDRESGVLTCTQTGADWANAGKDMSLQEAGDFFRDLMREFCFHPGDAERAMSVVLSGALGLFCKHMFAPEVIRPGFMFTANSEGAGKGLLATIAVVGPHGAPAVRTAPSENDEMEKLIFSKALGGGSMLFLDNLKGELSSPSLEALITSPYIEGRILGKSQEARLLHGLTAFITGNGRIISGDLRRRLLHVDLFVDESRAEDRVIKRRLDTHILLEERINILSAIWALVENRDHQGRLDAKITQSSFHQWSKVIGGILECAGFVSPFRPAPEDEESGDQTTRHITRLINVMRLNARYEFCEMVDLCKSESLLHWLVPQYGEMEDKQKRQLGRLFKKFVNRRFPSDRKLTIDGDTKDTKRFVVEQFNSPTNNS